jgi:hypothetical protein
MTGKYSQEDDFSQRDHIDFDFWVRYSLCPVVHEDDSSNEDYIDTFDSVLGDGLDDVVV